MGAALNRLSTWGLNLATKFKTDCLTIRYATKRVLTTSLISMRIVYFIESAEAGGAEQIVVTLADAFRTRGHDVSIITMQDGWLTEELDRLSLPRSRIDSRRSLDVTLPFRLAARFKDLKADVVHSHLLDSNFYGALACRLAGVRHVGTDHGDIHLPARKKLLKLKLRAVSLLGSSMTAVSKFTADKLIDLGVSRQLVSCIYNPIVPIERSAKTRTAIRQELGLSDDAWVWIHAAMMTRVKDQKTMLHAMQSCTENQYLLLAGDGPLREALKKEAAKCGVEDRVLFLGFRDDVPDLLSAADGFILSSLSESMPMSLLEAMSAGLLCVSTSVGGVTEVLDSERGYLFPPKDNSALARIMNSVCENRASCAEKAKSGQNFVRDAFGIERILNRYEQQYAL